MSEVTTPNWAHRMSKGSRVATLLIASVLAVFVAGMFIGFFYASIENGHLLPRKALGWLALGGMIGAAVGLFWLIRTLLAPSFTDGLTRFERRYSKMWIWVGSLGLPIGVAIALLSPSPAPEAVLETAFTSGPIPANAAILLSVLLLATLGGATVLYHRTIDDHEERAYLWGSQVAFYALAFALPVYWLLERGGVVPTLTSGIAMLLLLASFVIQGGVWAWFKFR
ncbi:hypothetical protein [Sphingomonas sp. LY160]|uniref:hypothetical protein n=1 Tax=Sphingomonas sp. LY160 TaxID=3095342 RepID=UPI002ADEB62E|nr:hypothetical protein [Sphingomonas sp. LY160]MEA1071494.1 hypothetical protein [Sphingomonas sp. LY160]